MIANAKIAALFVGAALLAALVVGLSFWAFEQVEDAAAARKDSYGSIIRAEALLSQLRDAETGQRGYLLTGDEGFLEPYKAVHGAVRAHLDELRALAANSEGRSHLDPLPGLVDSKLAEMAHVIELRRQHDLVGVMALVGTGSGKRLMDSIRAAMSAFIEAEDAVRARHDAQLQSNLRLLFAIIIAAALLTAVVALSFAILIRRETRHRLRSLVLAETRHLLDIQEDTNRALQHANLTLQASEDKLAVTLDSIGDAVISTDAEGRVTRLNPLAERLTGWTQAQSAGRAISEVFTPIDRETREPRPIPAVASLSQGAITGEIGHRVLVARDGTESAVVERWSPIRDRAAHVVGAVLVLRDVTDEHKARQELRDRAALIRAVLNTVTDGIITFNAQTGVVETGNPAADRMFGYESAQLAGLPLEPLIPELDRDRENGTLANCSAGEGLAREVAGRHRDGTEFPLEVGVSGMWLDDQRYYTAILRDISTRKHVEDEQKKLDQRLRDQQFYTRSLIESNIDALMTTDPAGIITDVNRQMEALTACTRDELIGATFKSFFTDPDRAGAAINLVLKEKDVTNYELTARARDGKETVVSCNATRFYDRDRRLQGVFAAARDITERRRLDEVLRERNVELESARFVADKANVAKSEFLSSMSHELRSPLNAILGFAQLMQSDDPPPTAGQKESIEQILLAGWHLLTLINEILDLAKVESGQVPLSEEPVSLGEVLAECEGMVEPQAQQHRVRLAFPRFAVPRFVRADRTRLKQVLINLLSNAIKYNVDNGIVEVDWAERETGRVRVSIRDSGAGLSPAQLAQLFQAFNRLGREAGPEEGTGIGLVVAKRLVELMGGTIGVESAVGVGSTFWFELLAVAEHHLFVERGNLAQPAAHPLRGAGRYTVLYVEDNPANLKLVELIVSRMPDLYLMTAVDATSGIEIARAFLPQVILMDINLPGIDGYEALAILRADASTAHIPVIAVSANAMPRDVERGRGAGFFRYITKPIKVDEFTAALDVALEFAQPELVREP